MNEPAVETSGRRWDVVAALAALVALSTAARAFFASKHTAPALFPDEYVYAAISRAIGHGSLHVRGGLTHFPEIVEPVLAAPIWRLLSIQNAYHGVQVENAVAASATAVPVYLLARFLQLSRRYSFVCAVYALLIPELVLVAFTSSDMVGYLAAAVAILAALVSLDRPSRRSQLLFLTLALVATLTRVEYLVLVPAYWFAALVLDRRGAFRTHAVAFLAVVPAAAVAAVAIIGYYQPSHLAPSAAWGRWLLYQSFLLVIESGVVLVPGAIAGVLSTRSRRERGFAAFAAAFAVLTLVEATKVAAEASRYTGRYLFAVVALIPIAFGLYLRNGRPHRLIVVGVAAALSIAAARIPVSQFNNQTSSEFLLAITDVQRQLGIGNGALLVAAATTACVAISVVSAYRPWTLLPLALAVGIMVAGGADATRLDIQLARGVHATNAAPDSSWIDRAAGGRSVAAIQTPLTTKVPLLFQMYWNPSVDREFLFGPAAATDPLRTAALHVGPDGTLQNVGGDFLFNSWATSATFTRARELSSFGLFSLWRPVGRARLRSAIIGRYADTWIASLGLIEAWPAAPGRAVEVAFRLSLPGSRVAAMGLSVGGTSVRLAPGGQEDVTCRSNRGALATGFVATTPAPLDPSGRRLAALMTDIRVRDVPAQAASPGPAQCARADHWRQR